MLMSAISQIKPLMPVVCSENKQFGVVDRVEGSDKIRLTRDEEGNLHYIPASWVEYVDDKVHIDRPGRQAMRQWVTAPKEATEEGAEAEHASGHTARV
jgi:hypothetical protein